MSPFRRSRHTILLSFAALAVTTLAQANDPYLLFERFLDRDRIPRLLSTVDFGLSSVQPEELEPIVADFDGNGAKDMAVAGTYTLPGKGGDFFLLVINDFSATPKQMMLKTGRQPFYLHRPGTTGESDPGNQAFAYSPCIHCSSGTDVFWSAGSKKYFETEWLPGARIPVRTPAMKDVDPKVADEALKIAGRLPDVRAFVDSVGRRGGELLTRVSPSKSDNPNRVQVSIYELAGNTKDHFQTLDIDTVKRKVMSRTKEDPAGPNELLDPKAEPDTAR